MKDWRSTKKVRDTVAEAFVNPAQILAETIQLPESDLTLVRSRDFHNWCETQQQIEGTRIIMPRNLSFDAHDDDSLRHHAPINQIVAWEFLSALHFKQQNPDGTDVDSYLEEFKADLTDDQWSILTNEWRGIQWIDVLLFNLLSQDQVLGSITKDSRLTARFLLERHQVHYTLQDLRNILARPRKEQPPASGQVIFTEDALPRHLRVTPE